MRENKNVSANEAAKALFRVITCQIKFEIFFSSLLLCPVFFYNNPPPQIHIILVTKFHNNL